MSTSDRNVGLLSNGESNSYAGMDDNAHNDGMVNKLRYRSPHLVLPLLITLAVALIIIISMLAYFVMHDSESSGSPVPPACTTCNSTSNGTAPIVPVVPALTPLHTLIHYEDANTHLNGLQQAASSWVNGTRQTGTPGYAASLDYVTSVLDKLTALRYRRQPWTDERNGRTGVNIIADTLTGDAANTVVMGGHLDSFGGPGLNDDGSGSTSVLLLAVAVNDAILSGNLTLVNRIRFHWYDAEEAGLVGSRAAVRMGVNATEVGERVQDWVCQMQADMVAAPNYILGIVDPTLLPPRVPNSTYTGSHTLYRMFREQFITMGYPFRNITQYHTQSDQWSYWVQGIPAAFLITGVFEIHTAEDVRDFGGMLGIAADPQIHTMGDNIFSINLVAQIKMTRVYAGVLQQLVEDKNIRTTLNVTHGQPDSAAVVSRIEEHWEEIVAEKKAAGRSGPEDHFYSWFPLAREWGVEL